MKQGNYYSAAEQFLYYVDHYYDEGIDDDESNENLDLQEKEDNKFLYVVKHYGIVIAGGSIIVAVMRKFILLLPLIFIMPHIFTSNPTMAVYMAEPIADFLAVSFTCVLFFFEFRKAMAALSN